MALPTSEGGGGTGAWNATACSHGPIPASQGVQGQGAHRHSYNPIRNENQNQNQNWSLTILGSSWRLSFLGGLLVTSEHAHEALQRGLQQCVSHKGTGTNKLPRVAQRHLEAGFLHKKPQQTTLTNTQCAILGTCARLSCDMVNPLCLEDTVANTKGKRKGGSKEGGTPAFSGVPNAKRGEQNQKWSPTKGNKIRSG